MNRTLNPGLPLLSTVVALVLLAGIGALTNSTVHAEEGQVSVHGGVQMAGVSRDGGTRYWGPGIQGGVLLGLSDSFRTEASIAGVLLLRNDEAGGAFSTTTGTITLQYMIDVITWVPYLELGGGSLLLGRDLVPVYTVGLGMDYRRWRERALGGKVSYYGAPLRQGGLGGDFPAYVALTFYGRYFIRLP